MFKKETAELLKIAKSIMSAYHSLNDFAEFTPALEKGNAEIWYAAKYLGFRWEEMGITFENFYQSHVLLGKIKEHDLDKIYEAMQGENWSPEGQAREFIKSKHTDHTSLSVGDVIVIGNKGWICDSTGWKELPHESK